MSKYIPPQFDAPRFSCPHCGAYAQQNWNRVAVIFDPFDGEPVELRECGEFEGQAIKRFHRSACLACQNPTFWYGEQIIFPHTSMAPLAHDDMPQDVREDFDEARSIVGPSPRGAAALLRLALQKLMVHLGEDGRDINKNIGSLVQKGLPIEIQQALDSVRIVGNESVHPGELNVNDTPGIALSLFEFLNIIVENRISQPKRLQAFYANLPESKTKGVANRDTKAQVSHSRSRRKLR